MAGGSQEKEIILGGMSRNRKTDEPPSLTDRDGKLKVVVDATKSKSRDDDDDSRSLAAKTRHGEDQTSRGGREDQESSDDDRIEEANDEEPEEVFGYKISRILERRSLSVVRVATKLETNQDFAVKIYDSSAVRKHHLQQEVKREITAISSLHHPNILKCHEVRLTDTKCYIFMELLDNPMDLWKKLRECGREQMNEGEARKYFHQLMRAVGHMHTTGVYHLDLNPNNILLPREGELIKVAHFGSCALRGDLGKDGLVHGISGKPPFSAPEISSGIETGGCDGEKMDIWSCGAILFTLVAGYHHSNKTYLPTLKAGDVKFPHWFSSSLKTLLKSMLDFNPSTRMTFGQVIKSDWYQLPKVIDGDMQGPFFDGPRPEERELEEISIEVNHRADEVLAKLREKLSSWGLKARGKHYRMKLSYKNGSDFGEAQISENGISGCEIKIQKLTGDAPSSDLS